MKIPTDVSQTDFLHWFFNDIVLVVLCISTVSCFTWWYAHNENLRVQHQCPGIAEKFHARYQITSQGCNIQTPTGGWVGVRID